MPNYAIFHVHREGVTTFSICTDRKIHTRDLDFIVKHLEINYHAGSGESLFYDDLGDPVNLRMGPLPDGATHNNDSASVDGGVLPVIANAAAAQAQASDGDQTEQRVRTILQSIQQLPDAARHALAICLNPGKVRRPTWSAKRGVNESAEPLPPATDKSERFADYVEELCGLTFSNETSHILASVSSSDIRLRHALMLALIQALPPEVMPTIRAVVEHAIEVHKLDSDPAETRDASKTTSVSVRKEVVTAIRNQRPAWKVELEFQDNIHIYVGDICFVFGTANENWGASVEKLVGNIYEHAVDGDIEIADVPRSTESASQLAAAVVDVVDAWLRSH